MMGKKRGKEELTAAAVTPPPDPKASPMWRVAPGRVSRACFLLSSPLKDKKRGGKFFVPLNLQIIDLRR